jgi:septal ring factor EnvC (AmiA/AmiB activator)
VKKEMLEKDRQRQAQKQSLEHIIASAKKAAADEEAAAAAAIAELKAKEEAAAERAANKKERARKKASMTPQEKEALKEKRLLKLVGAVVVKCMSKYAKSLDRDNFKKYAKEVRCPFLLSPHS